MSKIVAFFPTSSFQSAGPAWSLTANTANRLPVFTPLLQHILQDFASIRHIQNAENGKKIKNQVRNSRRFRVRSGFTPV